MSRRLLASYLTIAAIVVLALAIPLGVVFAQREKQSLTDKVARDAYALAAYSEDVLERIAASGAPDRALAPALTREIDAIAAGYTLDSGARVVIVRSTGRAIADTSGDPEAQRSFASRPEIARALAGEVAIGTRRSNTLGTDLLYVAVPVRSGADIHGAVRVTYPTSTIDARVRRVWTILIAVGVVVLAVSALVGLRFAKSIAGPLARLERASVAAGEGDLTVRAPEEGPEEVRSLAVQFNQMVARLGELVRAQEAFVADASHQLRTPLAAMRLRLENLEGAVDPSARDGLDAAVQEVDRLNRLVDGLLLLARADADEASPVAVDIGALVRERVELWSALGDEQAIRITGESQPGVVIAATPGRLEQVLDNLIENAMVALVHDGRITVRARRAGDHAELEVVDTGPGMTAGERERAFDRFWRSERNSADGTGLGLAIVRRLVEADDGTITLDEAPGGGLAARIRYRLHGRAPGGGSPPA